jgi:hypothetical protein
MRYFTIYFIRGKFTANKRTIYLSKLFKQFELVKHFAAIGMAFSKEIIIVSKNK